MQNQGFHNQISCLVFADLWQNHKTFFLGFDEPIEGIMSQAAILDSFAHCAHVYQERRVTDLAFQDYLQELYEKRRHQAYCFFFVLTTQTELFDQLAYFSIYFFFAGDKDQYFSVLGLKGLSQDVHHGSFEIFDAADTPEGYKSCFKVLIDHAVGSAEKLHEEVNDSFESELFGGQNVKISIEAVAFIKFCNFGGQLVSHGEGG